MIDLRETLDRGGEPTSRHLSQLVEDGISVITIAETFDMTAETVEEMILETD